MSHLSKPHQQRAIEEHAQVEERLTKIFLFMETDEFKALPGWERKVLKSQAVAMADYAGALQTRIRLWKRPDSAAKTQEVQDQLEAEERSTSTWQEGASACRSGSIPLLRNPYAEAFYAAKGAHDAWQNGWLAERQSQIDANPTRSPIGGPAPFHPRQLKEPA